MPHRQLANDPDATPHSPLRGLLIAVPLAVAFWALLAEAVSLIF